MATPDTQLIISIETVLKNLDRTLKGLSRVEKQLKTIAAIGPSRGSGFDRTTAAAERLRIKQERLIVQSQELSNRQERARQATERLALSNQRLEQAQARVGKAAATAGQQMDAHVRVFRSAQEQSRALNRQLNATGNALRSVGQGFASFGFTLAATLTAPLAAFGVTATRAAVSMDSLRRGLTAIVGSSEEASRQLVRLTEIAKLPGIGFEEAIQGSIRLQAVGFSAADAEKALIQFSNAIALTGGGREELARVTVQLGQLAAKGKVLAQDLKPIIEAAPAVGRALLQAFGTVNSEDIQELGLSSREFLDILVKQLGQLPRAAAGARNAFENFRDTVFRAAATVGEALLPVLTKLIDVAAPIITALAEGFKSLPQPLQVAVVLVGGLTAVLGPVLIIVGQLTLGIGRLMVGFAQLNAQGIIPATLSLRGFQATLASVATTTGAATAALAASTGMWIALGLALGAVAVAIAHYSQEEKKAVAIDAGAAKSRLERLKATEREVRFLEGLTESTSLSADQQKQLTELYKSLTGAAAGRVALLQTEQEKLKALIEAKKEQIRLDQFAAQATSAQLVTNAIVAIENRTRAQEKYNKAQAEFNRLLVLERQGLSVISADGNRVIRTLDRQKEVSLQAAEALKEIGESEAEVNRAAEAVVALSEATGVSTDEILDQARAAKVAEVDIAKVKKAIESFSRAEEDAADSIDKVTRALREQMKEFERRGEIVEKQTRATRAGIEGLIREIAAEAVSIEDAQKALEIYLKTYPQLRGEIEKLKKQGRFEDILKESLGLKEAPRSGTQLRNAQEAMAKALAEVARASADQQVTIEQAKNERLLQENESNFKLQLVAYRQYLNERARLTSRNLQLEIDQQQRVVDEATAERERFQRRLGQRLPPAERARVRAGEAEAEEKIIRAQTRINELQERQRGITDELRQALAESAQQQLDDIRQLEIQYAELQGRIQDALNAQVVEQFRTRLVALGQAQDDINKRLQLARETRDADEAERLERDRQQNQREIDSINNQIRLRDGLAALAAAEQLVTNAKEKQRLLEEQINFDVQFRGLAEEEAIRRRLEGERRLQQSLELSRSIIADTIRQLTDLGVTPPPELQKFVESLAKEIQGLGELPFSEQFRLAEKEFNRLNDERLRRIADVERAVRNRDIAEIEGRLLIKKINGEYVADLEVQLELLRRIAELSGQETLKRQAADSAETVKDAKNELADFDRQLRATSIDAFRDSFVQFFRDLRDSTENAATDFLNFLDRIGQRITDLIAENLADKLIESLLGTGDGEGGVIGFFKDILGIGDQQNAQVTQDNTTAVDANTQAINALTETFGGATPTAATVQVGGSLSGTVRQIAGIGTSIIRSLSSEGGEEGGGFNIGSVLGLFGGTGGAGAAAQGATVIDSLNIVADWLARLVTALEENTRAVQNSSSGGGGGDISGFLSLFSGGEASGDFLTARPGGRLAWVAEGGHDEAILTTDPRYAVRQMRILSTYLKQTKGLYGRIQGFEEGAFLSPRQAEMQLLSTIERNSVSLSQVPETALGRPDSRPSLNLRNINLFDRKAIAHDYLRSAEGARDILNIVSENGDEIGRRLGLK